MLSIRFSGENEWWVSGKVFDKLFQAAIDSGRLPLTMQHWRYVATANGGFSFSAMDLSEANELSKALRETAKDELARLEDVNEESETGTYRKSLVKLLEASDTR